MKRILTLTMICIISALCISTNSLAATHMDDLNLGKIGTTPEISQLPKDGIVHLTDKQEIKKYQESIGMKYDPDVVEVYRHIDIPQENAAVQALYFGNDYCIKNKKVTTKTDKSKILRQYNRPAGKVKISESISISNTFTASGGVTSKILTAQLGYNVTESTKFSISWSKSYKYPVTIKVYPIYSITTGEIWEKDVFFDDHVGNFTAKRAIGDDIIVSKNK